MYKKSFISVVCLLVLASVWSWAATTWQLQTKLVNTGGTLKVRNNPPQTVVGTTAFTNFTTSADVPVVVTANQGYRISAITRNAVTVPIQQAWSTHYTTSFSKAGGLVQNLNASFAAKSISISTQVSGPGTIAPSSTTVSYNGSVTLTATPTYGNGIVTSVTVNGATYNASYPYPGSLIITLSSITAPTTVSATFDSVTATVDPEETALVNTPMTLQGSSSGPATISWRQTSGPATVNTSTWNTATPTFTPSVAGTYGFTIVASVGATPLSTANTQIIAVNSATDYSRLLCMGCHGASGAVPFPQTYTGWSSSKHRTANLTCVSCHTTGAMPTPVSSSSVNKTTFLVTAASAGSVGSIFCSSCHQPGQIHRTPGMSCANCHGSWAQHSPDTTFTAAATACFTCHGSVNTTHYHTKGSLTANQCVACHTAQGHNAAPAAAVVPAHFNGYTSYTNPGYAAAYVTPETACGDCHQAGDPASSADIALASYRTAWAASKHGAPTGAAWANSKLHNWKASGTEGANAKASVSVATDCQRCHTPLGYLRFAQFTSLSPVTAQKVAYSEPLTCNACHQSGDFATPRAIGQRTGYYNYSSAVTGRLQVSYLYPDAGRSNICLGCHTGRAAGSTIDAIAGATAHKAYSTAFWQDTAFVNSHYLSAGGQLYGATGYHYPGVSYSSGANHSKVGSNTGQGPCVACHMAGTSHTLKSSAGSYALCNDCHLGTIDGTFLSDKEAQFDAALKALAAALTNRGFAPVTDAQGVLQYPYFTARNWGNAQTAAGNLGAAFNYNLLAHDPGAFAHNPSYTKRLVRDSIDYLLNGSVSRSRDISDAAGALLSDGADRQKAEAFLANSGSGAVSCEACHLNAVDPLKNQKIFDLYSGSLHATKPGGATCSSCHAPAAEVGHPTDPMLKDQAQIAAKCLDCHDPHTWNSAGICMNCHNGHNPGDVMLGYPHYGSFSTAQYITTNVKCDNCHTTENSDGKLTFEVYSANAQWARSGKGNPRSASWTSFDFKTMGSAASPATSAATDCVRCHTTTGYVNYVSNNFQDIRAWGTSGLAADGDHTREMAACSTCHNPTPFRSFDSEETDDWGMPLQPAYSRRVVPQVTAYYNYSSRGSGRVLSSLAVADQGISNNCAACHSGTRAGSTLVAVGKKFGTSGSIAATNASFWGNTPFIDTHGMGAAGILYTKSGYMYTKYRGYAPAADFAHDGIDDAAYAGQGPCVACHMYTPKQHLFSPVSSAQGVIGKVTGLEDLCIGCHDGGIRPIDLTTPTLIQAKKEGFQSSLRALQAVLAAKGIHYNAATAPYFFKVSDPAQQVAANAYTNWKTLNATKPTTYYGQDVMGAAFNLRLLSTESGAYAHNSTYTRRLIYDSIDLMDDGAFNSSVFTTIQNATTSDSFNEADKARAKDYVGLRP